MWKFWFQLPESGVLGSNRQIIRQRLGVASKPVPCPLVSGPHPGPDGGLGPPIAPPDPLSGSKMWLLGGIAVLLGGVAFFVLRKRNDVISATPHGAGGRPVATLVDLPDIPVQLARASAATPAVAGQGVLIESLKEELFALEQDKVSGKISDTEYADAKAGFEAMLRRILKTR